MGRLHWLLVVVLVPACAPNDPPTSPEPPESGAQEPTTLTRVLKIADHGSRTETQVPVSRSRLVGRYFTGDGTGFNLKLDLQADGSFDLTWTGCLGVYGTAAGIWALDPDGVSITTAKADGLLANRPLDRLRVATMGGHYVLVEERSRKLFDEFGLGHGTCLHQEEAGPMLEVAWEQFLYDPGHRDRWRGRAAGAELAPAPHLVGEK